MRVLVIGSGGREDALCWKLARSSRLGRLYCAPGNPGTSRFATNIDLAVDDLQGLAAFAAKEAIDLTVVGPELPLVLGLADFFAERGLRVFGPSRAAAQLEGSKVFAKEFMGRHGIPTAKFAVVESAAAARREAGRFGLPVVLKADGLAAGKGVLIAADEDELEAALTSLFDERRFGAAADRVVVEECLQGEEVSMIALSDGERVLPMATSKDYKRIGEGDQGPNTGGMGAHSPAGVLGRSEADQIVGQVMRPVVQGMASEGHPFRGVLYAGMMLTPRGPQVLEFNVRLGDPEAQPLLMRLESDLLPVLAAGADGQFVGEYLEFNPGSAACVVLASAGYPQAPRQGDPIAGLEAAAARPGVQVFHAGTASQGGEIVATGGRVLNVCATGGNLKAALDQAYLAVDEISWEAKVYRRDIGRRMVLED